MEYEFAGRMLAALAVIAAVLFALQYVARYGSRRQFRGGRSAGRLVTVLETTPLPNGSSLHVVKVGDRYVVIGRSSNSLSTLCDLPSASVEAWLAAQDSSPLGPVALSDLLTRLGVLSTKT